MYIHNLTKDEVMDAMKNGVTVFITEKDCGDYNFSELKYYQFYQILEFLERDDCGFFTISK